MDEKKCYWIALEGRMARTNCGEYVYLSRSLNLPENKGLQPYEGRSCPKCGNIIFVDEHSYDLIKES